MSISGKWIENAMETRDWIELGAFLLATCAALISCVRYIDTQIAEIKLTIAHRTTAVDAQLNDKVSIGEFSRRQEDVEKRLRLIERWQDHANGRVRYFYPDKNEPEPG